MKLAVRLLATLLGLWVLLCVFYYVVQDDLIFQGAQPAPVSRALDAQPIETTVAATALRGYVVNPAVAGTVVFYFGGNAEAATAYAHEFAMLPARSYLIDYRGYGSSEGAPSQVALVADATHHVRTFAGATEQVVLVGRSLGSGVAALAAADLGARVARLILISPFCSFSNVVALHAPGFLPSRALLMHPFAVDQVADRLPRAVTLISGAADKIIPPAESRCLANALGGATTMEVAAAGHNDLLRQRDIWQAIRNVVTSAAGEPPRRVLL
ncbi:MAG: alpha/beta hydrolase [Gammaproteobacteria bacterium]|nr:alpha/beta hydrolase [Gammaproteobacteria bacterium]